MPILQAESATVICQRAMGLAEHRVNWTSLEDTSPEAREARLRYDHRRRAILEMLDWRFARRRVWGQAVPAAVAPFQYPKAWSIPPETLRIRGVFREGRDEPLRMSREQYLFTEDVAAVQIVYTGDAFNTALFPPAFTTALELLLAADFVMVFARSINRRNELLADLRRSLEEADAIEAGERGEDPAFAPGPWAEAVTDLYGRGTGQW